MSFPSSINGGNCALKGMGRRSMINMTTTVTCIALCGGVQASVTYNDSVSDLLDNGLSNLDISSVDVDHDDDNIYMTINLAGGIGPGSDWGKYLVAFDAYDGGTGSNPWGRNIDFNGTEIDRFIGSWPDGGGGLLGYHHFDGWNETNDGISLIADASGIMTYTISREWLGSDINSFNFDVMTTGNGDWDPGVDHLSRSDMATSDWGEGSVSGEFLTYNLPAPGALALLALAGCVRGRRRRH
jgi:hypothetical protein